MRAPRTATTDLETVCGLALAALVLAEVVGRPALRLAAMALLATALWSPAAALVGRTWHAIAGVLGRVNAWVFLGAAFLLVLTPVAWLRRLLGQEHPAF